MRHLILIGGVAAGVLLYLYEYWYKNSANQYSESPYGGRDGRPDGDEDEYIVVNETAPKKTLSNRPKLPSKDEQCVICLDFLIRRDETRGYAIIALPQCGHWFHQKCAIRLLEYHPSCPICRLPMDNNALRGTPVRVIESSSEGDSDNYSQPSSTSCFESGRTTSKKDN